MLLIDAGDAETARQLAKQGIELDETVIENYLVMYHSYQEEDELQADIWLLKYLLHSVYGVNEAIDELLDAGVSFLGRDGEQAAHPLWERMESREIVARLVFTEEDVKRDKDEFYASEGIFVWTTQAEAYLDIERNIGYFSMFFTSLAFDTRDETRSQGFQTEKGPAYYRFNQNYAWKPIIIRIHNPQIYSAGFVQEQLEAGVVEDWFGDYGDFISKYNKFIAEVYNRGDGDFQSDYFAIIVEDNIPLEQHLKNAGYSLDDFVFVDIK